LDKQNARSAKRLKIEQNYLSYIDNFYDIRIWFPYSIVKVYFGFISGRFLDIIARKELWAGGLDYKHGTGHGVGMFLNVHEGR
jgi:hypothetical protein